MPRPPRVTLLVGTNKGAFFYRSNRERTTWKLLSGPHFLGSVVNHVVQDPRDPRSILMAAKSGHLGPTIFRSNDAGTTWKEASIPPAFPKVARGAGRAVTETFWLTAGHASQQGSWYVGTSPHGLFRSDDRGVTWSGVTGFNESRDYRRKWTKNSATPSGPLTHSILVDPRNPDHLYLSLSTGGFFESTTGGAKWKPLNQGLIADFLPVKEPEFGQDPHCVVLHPLDPDRLYQQNHCGIYRMDRAEGRWVRIGTNMPEDVGDIGFGIVTKPQDVDTAWVIPMDGTDAWPRTSPRGAAAVYRTKNGGKSWQRLAKGLPTGHTYWTVLRQAFANDAEASTGLYFGTTSGEIWASGDEGDHWAQIVGRLPRILSVTVAVG